MIKLGVIGAGRVAQVHIAQLSGVNSVQVAAVADSSVRASLALSEKTGAQSFTDFKDLLASGIVDAVDIALPHQLHYEVACAALEKGLHVFLEKPLAGNLADARAIAEVASKSESVFMVSHNLLFHPAVIQAKQLLSRKPIGRLTSCRAWSRGWLDLTPDDFRHSSQATGGGAWIDTSSHLLYVLEDLVSPLTDVVVLRSDGESRIGGEDNAAGSVRFEQGGTGTLEISYADWNSNSSSGWPAGWNLGYQFFGTEGMFQLDLAPSALIRIESADSHERIAFDVPFDDSFGGAFREFFAAIEEGRRPRVSAQDALRTFEQVFAAESRDGWSGAKDEVSQMEMVGGQHVDK